LKEGFVDLPAGPGPGQPMIRFRMDELGISHPILAFTTRPKPTWIYNPDYHQPTNVATGGVGPGLPAPGVGTPMPGGVPGAVPGAAPIDPNNPEYFPATQYWFGVQFVWRETPLLVRLEN